MVQPTQLGTLVDNAQLKVPQGMRKRNNRTSQAPHTKDNSMNTSTAAAAALAPAQTLHHSQQFEAAKHSQNCKVALELFKKLAAKDEEKYLAIEAKINSKGTSTKRVSRLEEAKNRMEQNAQLVAVLNDGHAPDLTLLPKAAEAPVVHVSASTPNLKVPDALKDVVKQLTVDMMIEEFSKLNPENRKNSLKDFIIYLGSHKKLQEECGAESFTTIHALLTKFLDTQSPEEMVAYESKVLEGLKTFNVEQSLPGLIGILSYLSHSVSKSSNNLLAILKGENNGEIKIKQGLDSDLKLFFALQKMALDVEAKVLELKANIKAAQKVSPLVFALKEDIEVTCSLQDVESRQNLYLQNLEANKNQYSVMKADLRQVKALLKQVKARLTVCDVLLRDKKELVQKNLFDVGSQELYWSSKFGTLDKSYIKIPHDTTLLTDLVPSFEKQNEMVAHLLTSLATARGLYEKKLTDVDTCDLFTAQVAASFELFSILCASKVTLNQKLDERWLDLEKSKASLSNELVISNTSKLQKISGDVLSKNEKEGLEELARKQKLYDSHKEACLKLEGLVLKLEAEMALSENIQENKALPAYKGTLWGNTFGVAIGTSEKDRQDYWVKHLNNALQTYKAKFTKTNKNFDINLYEFYVEKKSAALRLKALEKFVEAPVLPAAAASPVVSKK